MHPIQKLLHCTPVGSQMPPYQSRCTVQVQSTVPGKLCHGASWVRPETPPRVRTRTYPNVPAGRSSWKDFRDRTAWSITVVGEDREGGFSFFFG